MATKDRTTIESTCPMRVHEPLTIQIYDQTETEEYSTTKLNGQFLHFQLLIDLLLRLKSTSTDRKDLISYCKNEYETDPYELTILEEFERTYSSKQAIWWYTREAFLYRILNKSLRTQNIDLLYLLRFFLHDLHKQLKSNQYVSNSTIRTYRSQLMSFEELDRLKNSLGQLISINSFFSTSLNRRRALSFLSNSRPNFASVLFEIDADPCLNNIKPFTLLTTQSYFPEEDEVLFMLGSIFRLEDISQEDDHRWIIRMTLTNEKEFQSIFNSMKEDYGDYPTNLLAFGKLLWKMGKYSQAEKYLRQLLNQLPTDHPLISYCYRALGNVADDQGDYEASLKWHLQSLDPNSSLTIQAESYNNIGCVYDHQEDYRQALTYYRKAWRIWKDMYGENHLNLAACLNNIACIYSEQDQSEKALEYYRKVLSIREENLPKNHPDIGASHQNLGEVYRRLADSDQALKHFNLSKDIYQLSLPSQHPDRAEIYMNIGLVYRNLHQSSQALKYYRKALKIYQQTFPSTHPSIEKLHQLITELA